MAALSRQHPGQFCVDSCERTGNFHRHAFAQKIYEAQTAERQRERKQKCSVFDFLLTFKRQQYKRVSSHRVGETGGLDDDVIELVSSLQQRLQRGDKVVLDGAANAAVLELKQVVGQDGSVGAILVTKRKN